MLVVRSQFRPFHAMYLAVIVLAPKLLMAGDTTPNVNLYPDQRAVISFHFAEPPTSKIGAVDFIWNSVGGSFADFHDGSFIDYYLYDRGNLLSFHTDESICCLYHAPGSLIQNTASVEIDFATVIDASIQATFVLEPTFIDPSEFSMISTWFDFISGTATSAGSFWRGPSAIITDCKIEPVPFGDGFENNSGLECEW